MIVESKVGSKGELFLTKNIRNILGLHPGDKIFFEIKDEILIVRRVPDLLELLEEPSLSKPETPSQIEQDIEEFYKNQEKYSNEDLL